MKKIKEKLGSTSIDAIFLSHDHGDHTKGVGPFGRKTKVPIYLHESVYNKKVELLKNCEVRFMKPSEIVTVKDLQIQAFSTKHDATYTFGYLITDADNKKLCYLTDTGSVTPLMMKYLEQSDAILIEADYDDHLLEEYEGYDQFLKDRITSNFGHLSNAQCIETLQKLNVDEKEFVIYAHLSPRANSPETVTEAILKDLPKHTFYIAPCEEIVL